MVDYQNIFSHIIGNDPIKKCLVSALNQNRLRGGYLFSGPRGIGKSLFAKALAKCLIGEKTDQAILANYNHPDFEEFFPEGKISMHSIDSMRRFSEEVFLPPYEANCKVFVIHDAHRMLPYSANALLKTFEEPPKKSIIVLLTDSIEHILPTIRSRLRTLYFHQIQKDQISSYLCKHFDIEKEKSDQIAELAEGSIEKAIKLLDPSQFGIRKKILERLSVGKFTTYSELHQFAKDIADDIENLKSEYSEEAKKSFLADIELEDLTATQKNKVLKEVEAKVNMCCLDDAKSILNDILLWWRDLNLLYHTGGRSLLKHRDYDKALLKQVMESEPFQIESVQAIVKDACVSLERSTPIFFVLENLFLKLKLI